MSQSLNCFISRGRKGRVAILLLFSAWSDPDSSHSLARAILRSGAAPEVEQVTFELSTDAGSTWTPLGSGTRMGWSLLKPPPSRIFPSACTATLRTTKPALELKPVSKFFPTRNLLLCA